MLYKYHHVCGLESLLSCCVQFGPAQARGARAGATDSTLSQVNPLPRYPSPDTIMSLPKSLGLALAACVSVAATRQPLSNLYDNCELTVHGSRYDLCPLFHDLGQGAVVIVHAELAPTVQLSYEMSFGGPLSPQSGEEAGPQVRATDATGPVLYAPWTKVV